MAIIYMAQGANGLFKVGMTSALSSRKNTLKKEFSKRGDVLAKIEPIAEVKDDFARSVEYRLIGYVRGLGFAPCSGREWFRGVAFDDIKVKAPQVIKEAISRGLIRKVDFAPYPSSNGYPKPTYVKGTK